VRLISVSLVLSLALALTACGRQEPSGLAPAKAPAPATAPAIKNTAPAPAKTGADAEKPQTLTRLNEDGSETVEETPGDTGAHNPLLAAVASTVAAATSTASAATGSQWPEGSYTRVVPAQPTDAPAGQVEVLEFFWYACPHCFALDPLVQNWEKTKPAYISFSRVPVLWNEGHRSLGRLFYTLQTMGKLNQFHADIFKEIQVNGDPLIGPDPNNVAAAERVQVAFVKRLGISDTDFEKQYHGFTVDSSLQRADQLVQRYRVTGVPTFVVNGKYVADVASAGSPERLMQLVSDLAAQEHKH
jgi:protein dithiol oxidoreductase (disulfide-forming)